MSIELAVRQRRATFNRALADANIGAIGPILARDAILVAGSDSAVLSGRKAQLLAWKREFSVPDRIVYTRIPETVLCSPVEPIAMEHGHWQGVIGSTAASLASGIYAAKWRLVESEWLIEAEIYVTMA